MLSLKFFEGWTIGLPSKSSPTDRDLMAWAKTEYKNDAEWAFAYMKRTGNVPPTGDRHAREMVI
jgi:hypothetical protein